MNIWPKISIQHMYNISLMCGAYNDQRKIFLYLCILNNLNGKKSFLWLSLICKKIERISKGKKI